MSVKIHFDDLEEEARLLYLTEAYDQLYADGQIPYDVSTGDNDIWSDYNPVINLAIANYNSQDEAY